ncbi:hypothetical protein F5050DRAFT_1712794 [Lentinula boryana]|uniref:Non-specific serine/threonine protein kinase n=1 Tax=Lentinula boryana TaxID=40481 RepID=A0ABQ8QAL0_9AGAR|nr:hypothetical protein F5050DRAFT_1712794 [Lentinula boryana]
MSNELCAIYSNEDARETSFRELLGEFLQPCNYCRSCGMHQIEVTINFLLRHVGPNIQVFGGAMVDRPQVEVLTPNVPMHFYSLNEAMFLDLAHTLTAFNMLFIDIGNLYRNPPKPGLRIQYTFPYPRDFEQQETKIRFTYLKRVDRARLVFMVKREQDDFLFVEFAMRYGEDAHRKAYQLHLAPELLAIHTLEGGWKMIVMRLIPKEYEAVDDIISGQAKSKVSRENMKSLVQNSSEPFLNSGYVHGDLRGANICVHVEVKNVLMFDFDWAGLDGKVTYPMNVGRTETIWRPNRELSSWPIKSKDDRPLKNLQ